MWYQVHAKGGCGVESSHGRFTSLALVIYAYGDRRGIEVIYLFFIFVFFRKKIQLETTVIRP